MTEKKNGKKIVKFPSFAERDQIRKKQQQESEWRSQYKSLRSNDSGQPFFKFGNIPLFAKFLSIALFLTHAAASVFLDDGMRLQAIYDFAFVPGAFTGQHDWQWWTPLTVLSYNFLHSGWTHMIFNALMALALGSFFEKTLNGPAMLKLFFLSGVGGALIFFVLNPGSTVPVIGASGSVSGLFAAAIMLMYEQGRFGALTGKLAGRGPWPLIAIWAGVLVLFGMMGDDIAWQAHLGGFLSGAGLYHLMRKGHLRF